MQRQASLQHIIGTYRLVFAGVAALVLVTGLIALLGYFTDPRAIEMVVVRVLAGASLLLCCAGAMCGSGRNCTAPPRSSGSCWTSPIAMR